MRVTIRVRLESSGLDPGQAFFHPATDVIMGDMHFQRRPVVILRIIWRAFLNAIWRKSAAAAAVSRQAALGLVRQTTDERSPLKCPETSGFQW
jgi:hypothetical protein